MRYHLFAGQGYYPQSGLGDYVGGFDHAQDAADAGRVATCKTRPEGFEGHWYPDDWYSVITEKDGRLIEVSSGWGHG